MPTFNNDDAFDIRRHFGSKSPYNPPQPSDPMETPMIEGCTLKNIHLVVRHGARNPTIGDIEDFESLSSLLKEHRDKIPPQFEYLKEWYNPFKLNEAGWLGEEGVRGMWELGKRMRERYRALLGSGYDYPKHRTTMLSRTGRSAAAFTAGLFDQEKPSCTNQTESYPENGLPAVYVQTLPRVWDYELTPKHSCPLHKPRQKSPNGPRTSIQLKEWRRLFQPMLQERVKFGFAPSDIPFRNEDVQTMYKLCAFEVLLMNPASLERTWCKVLLRMKAPEESVRILEYFEDLKHWYKYGYGDETFNSCMSLPGLKNALNTLSGENGATSWFGFSHEDTLTFMYTGLGLFNESVPITANNTMKLLYNRTFLLSEIGSMGSSMVFEGYSCPSASAVAGASDNSTSQPIIRIRVNERLVVPPRCESLKDVKACTLKELEDQLVQRELMCPGAKDRDTRFLTLTRNLQSQLNGLEKSLLLSASSKFNHSSSTSLEELQTAAADLDSPLEKAMMALRSLLLDPSFPPEHQGTLELILACLSCPDLLEPDLDFQVREGQVEIDEEQRKWLFYEVAKRKDIGLKLGSGSGVIMPVSVDVQEVGEEGGVELGRKQQEVDEVPGPVVGSADVEFPDAVVIATSSSSTLSGLPSNLDVPSTSEANAPPQSTSVATSVGFVEYRRGSASGISSSGFSNVTPTRFLSTSELSTMLDTKTVHLLSRINEFNFPIFDFASATSGRPLVMMAYHLCVSSGLVGKLGLSVEKFITGMATIEGGYHSDLSFHNSLHAADVLHCINYLIQLPTLQSTFTDLDRLAIYLAAIIHDFDHPGVNNHFLVASSDRRALLYNDKSVLENHHAAAAFEVLSRPACGFLSGLDKGEYKTLRESVVEMVLATDLAQHFSLLTLFKKKVLTTPDSSSFDPLGTREDRTLLMQMLMKAADVSNPTKVGPEYDQWITRIQEEWYHQGDLEKSLGLPISPFCNRDVPTNTASSQSGFINFIVAPLFEALGGLVDIPEAKRGIEINKARWAPPPAPPPTPSTTSQFPNVFGNHHGGRHQRKQSVPAIMFLPRSPSLSPSTPRRNKSSPSLPGLAQAAMEERGQQQLGLTNPSGMDDLH
ncbi:hypothetical protein HDV05_003813 [Chytridiales sp. JEL 0842]|nr:hypothetical protein HDV05_003813 [Chytridiales sp. JEL 0842]